MLLRIDTNAYCKYLVNDFLDNEIKPVISNELEMYIVEYNRHIRDTTHKTRSIDRSTLQSTTIRKLLKMTILHL